LEKIEMKKTLVAVAAMAAVTGAMADVTISGQFDQAYNTVRSTQANGTSQTQTNLDSNALGQDAVTFSVAEDVGNGITAFAALSTVINVTTPQGNVRTDNGSGIGLKGAFGKFALGQSYSSIFFTSADADASGWGTGVGNVHGVGAGGVSNGISYVLPSFIPGFTLNLEKSLGETNGTRNGDAQGGAIAYDAGGFHGKYAMLTYRATRPTVGGVSEFTVTPAIGNVAATTQIIVAGSSARISALALTYDFQVAKIYAGYNAVSSGGNSNQTQSSSTYGVSAPFGALSVGLAASNASYRQTSGASVTATGTRLLTSYAFSKRTSAYFQYGVAKLSGNNGSATGNGFGLWHRF